ncbi:hypothetical protein CANINC_005002 [Pichia inconspicua]|uniref:Double-strand break repair protein n=1 Tax=Pichia inconspicua TaxID=52247 RepID=A0A4T0WVQ1_9ASCO|nr:hypothetical protein CANINC_005002 [[Candida] inconspicua]
MPEVSYIEPGPDTFRILLTTDNHVGYMENDKVRGDDSWKTFAEILKIGREQDVDMIVQGGDLFHVNAPTKKSYYHVMRALREYCWCDKPIEYRLVSDPSDAMATKHFVYPAEYDMNVNVGMPLYAISGNHDDATGEELLSPLDILSVSGLINHFGRVIDNEQITVCPLLFNKGKTNLALYGLHSVREERLMKTMASGNLEFLEPDTEEDGDSEESVQWFNLMCIHQNHVHRPGVKVVEETCLPTFLDFVLWGHEHDCKPVAVQNDITGTYILQAGSSIATSLSEGETLDKHVYVLSVKGKDFSLQPIKLKTVRPFIMKDIVLSRSGLSATSSNKKEVLNYLMIEVELMIENAKQMWKDNNKELFEDEIFTDADIPLPLIRLRVEYSGGYEVENPRFFSNRFVGRVANINDVVLFYKKKRYDKSRTKLLVDPEGGVEYEDDELHYEDGNDEFKEEENNILDLITDKLDDKDLIMLTKRKVADALSTLVTHEEDKQILNKFVQKEEEEHIELLQELSLEDGSEDDGTGNGNLNISENVRDVKKSFRELAKRIKAETQYQSDTTAVPNSGPMMYNASLGTNVAASTIKQSKGTISSKRTRTKVKPALSRYNKAQSDEFVVDTSEDEDDTAMDGVKATTPPSPPPAATPPPKKRTRPSALDAIFQL